MTPLRSPVIIIAIGAASVLAGVALILGNQPVGRGLIIAGCIGLALTLIRRR